MATASYYHIGILVNDLQLAIQHYSKLLGVKFTEATDSVVCLEDPTTGNVEELVVAAAYSRSGQPYLELIEAIGEGVFAASNANQILYFGVWEPNLERRMAVLQKQGISIEAVLRPDCDKPPIAFITGPDAMGIRIEYVASLLRGSTLAWVRTGKLPGSSIISSLLTVWYTFTSLITGFLRRPKY